MVVRFEGLRPELVSSWQETRPPLRPRTASSPEVYLPVLRSYLHFTYKKHLLSSQFSFPPSFSSNHT